MGITANGTVEPVGNLDVKHPVKLNKLGWIYIPEDTYMCDTLEPDSIGVCKLYTANVCNIDVFFVNELFWKYNRFIFSTKILKLFPEEVESYLSVQHEAKEKETKDALYRAFMCYRSRKERCDEISK